MERKQLHDGTHMTKSERGIIQAGIENGSAKTAIARTIGKDATTIPLTTSIAFPSSSIKILS
jgi:IS30 family transposase